MIIKTITLLIPFVICVLANDAVEDVPTRILDLKNVIIEDYHGPMNAKTMSLFKNVETLSFRGCNFSTFDENFFHPLKNLKNISTSHSHFARVKNDMSVCCKNLLEIELISTNMGPFAEEEFKKVSEMKKLERLYIFRNDVPVLKTDFLKGSNMKILEMEFDNLETIEDGAFNGMDKLEVLNLMGNKLKAIPTKSLEALKNLKHLDLKRNLLEKVTVEDFPVMPNLETINLGQNPVKDISLKGLKEKLPKLKEVDVSEIEVDQAKNEGIPLIKTQVL